MLEIKKSEFKPENYKKLTLITNHKNGNQIYEFIGACPRCGGTGFYKYTTLDEQRCWECEGFKQTIQKLRVITDINFDAREAKREEEARKFREGQAARDAAQIKRHLDEGYKLVDFKVAGWFFNRPDDVEYNHDKYYIIKKDTDKAVLISFIDTLTSGVSSNEWFPKKAIVR